MPYVNERGVLSGSRPWSLSRISDVFWDIFNVACFFFRTLIDPFTNLASSSGGNSNSHSGRGPPRPPRGPRGNFRSFSDTIGPPGGNFPMAGG